MKSLRVCFLAAFSYGLFYSESKQSFGGAEVQLYQLATALAKEGLDVSCILANFGQQEEVVDGVRLLRSFPVLPNGPLQRLSIALTGPFVLFRALHRAQADVYVQRAASFETGLVALYCLLARRRFIYMVAHERDCTGQYGNKNGIRGWLYRFGLHRADTVVAQHQDQRVLLKAHEGIESVVFPTVYPMYPHESSFEHRSGALWVGRLLPWKQPDLFLAIARALPNEVFTMIGDGSGAFADSVKSEAIALPNVTYLSHVSFCDITAYFAKVRCFVNTSQAEGYPNTFAQSLQCGTPICSLSIDPEDFLSKEGVGLCTYGKLDHLIDSVRRCLQDQTVFDAMHTSARQLFRERHSIDIHLSRFIALLYE